MRQFTCEATQHTEDLGERLGRIAVPGLYVVLEGDLGAGKTAFARGVGRGLGVTSRVQSPSFILVHLHEHGRLPLAHADLYRLGDTEEVEILGLDDVREAGGVALVEWADRCPESIPADHLRVRIDFAELGRVIHISASGDLGLSVLEAL